MVLEFGTDIQGCVPSLAADAADAAYWQDHYESTQVPPPSLFALHVAARHLRHDDHLVELGCGSGRDAQLLAQFVASYHGIDRCAIATQSCLDRLSRLADDPGGRPGVSAICDDFTETDFERLAPSAGRLVLYSRFSLHSVSDAQARQLWENLSAITGCRWLFLLEARTIHDDLYGVGVPAGTHAFRTDHYRRFIDPPKLRAELARRYELHSFQVSAGLAPFRGVDPVVVRAAFSGPRVPGSPAGGAR